MEQRFRADIQAQLASLNLKDDERVLELLPERDPRFYEASERVRQLDRILLRAEEREKEAKRKSAQLRTQIRQELLRVHAPSPSQLEENAAQRSENSANCAAATAERIFATEFDFDDSQHEQQHETAGHSEAATLADKRIKPAAIAGWQTQRSDFLLRNIELAGAHAQPVAMTTAEAARLQQLLSDIDEVSDSGEAAGSSSQPPGEGYTLSEAEALQLRAIDSELSRICSANRQQQQQAADAATSQSSQQQQRPGERALAEARAERLRAQRLEQLDRQLLGIADDVAYSSSDFPV